MRTIEFKTLGILLMVILLSVSADIFAQRGRGWGQNSNYGRNFNPQTVKTISGTIMSIDRIMPDKKMSYGLHLKVKTEAEIVSVHLGPTWYLDNQEIQFVKGDMITFTGSAITFQKAPAIIAAEISKDGYVLLLRDKNGFPVWSGWRKMGMRRGRNIN